MTEKREIKFRAWDKHRRCMVWPLSDEGRFSDGSISASTTHRSSTETYDLPLMQYTGLKDKNGEEIYEGDVIISNYFPKHARKVEYFESSAMFGTLHDGRKYHLGRVHATGSAYPLIEYEVIGNIYENTELLSSRDGDE